MKRYDRICCLICIVFGALVMVLASSIPMGRISKPGPGFLPFWVGATLILLSIFLWVESGVRKPTSETVQFLSGEGRWPNVIWTAGSLLGFAFLVESLGFILSALLLLFFLFRFIGNQKWGTVVTATVIVTLAAYGLFRIGLKVQLPRGFF